MDWLRDELIRSHDPVMIFVHQLLDEKGSVYVKNAELVRKLLEDSGKVLAVFQGHHHPGQYNKINDIHYYTLKAMVEGSGKENNFYAVVDLQQDKIVIQGYRKAVSHELTY